MVDVTANIAFNMNKDFDFSGVNTDSYYYAGSDTEADLQLPQKSNGITPIIHLLGENFTYDNAAHGFNPQSGLIHGFDVFASFFGNQFEVFSISGMNLTVADAHRAAGDSAFALTAIQAQFAGADHFQGSSGNDLFNGYAGSDTMDGGAGADTMAGGIGNDFYYVDDAGDKVVENAGEGAADTVYATSASYTLAANVERLSFTDTGNHTGKGNELSNLINGNAGLDKFLIDAGGNDTFSGGGGEDTFDARSSATGMVLRLDAQANNAGSVTGDTFASVEKFFGSDTAADAMTTGAARAKFFGYGGNDTLTGGSSVDALSGGAGNDSLVGNGGSDALDGGVGNDTMTGGAAKDTFTFVDAAFGQDLITDFQDNLDKLKVFSAVAHDISDFTIAGNGTSHVVLTLNSAPTNIITLDGFGGANITLDAHDFLFY